MPYNTTSMTITWEKSTIRSWLNGYDASYNKACTSFTSDNFIDAAFTAEEKSQIVQSYVPAHANPSYSTSSGNATTDKIFLLSLVEAKNYILSDDAFRATATPYVQAKSVYGNSNNDFLCSWWLRSPGSNSERAGCVTNNSDIGSDLHYVGAFVESTNAEVRPALWVNL